MTKNSFGKGCGIYMSSFSVNNQNTKMLLNLILQAGGEAIDSAII